jgi:Cytochrome P460
MIRRKHFPAASEVRGTRITLQVWLCIRSINRRDSTVTSNIIRPTTAVITFFAVVTATIAISRSFVKAETNDSRYLPDNIWRTWVFVGSPLTPNALNQPQANFPEYHNVYMQPWAYEEYKKTNQFPEGTIMFKELQLTLPPSQFKDGSRKEPSGRGYFPGPFNGADVTVKDSKRYADTGNWGYFDFNHHEPKLSMTKAEPKDACAFCHIQSAQKDEVWTQFYQILQ